MTNYVGASKLLFMTPGFEIITEVVLSPEDVTQHINQVSVGWGRSETQFRGLRAKNAPRDPTLPQKVDEGVLSPNDDSKVRLHWRGDGEVLALSRIEYIEGKSAKRVIRVYTRDGKIESFNEPIDGLEGVLNWRPSGNWIAAVQRKGEHDAEIVFMERNGLRHGGFDLRKPGGQIRGLAWNSDSSVLAVLLRDRIQLWTVSNYDWQLKQEIAIIRKATETFNAIWHPEKPFVLFTYTNRISNSGVVGNLICLDNVERYDYVSDLCKDPSSWPFDYGIVAVLDGETLRLTPYRIRNIPPPMAANMLPIASTPAHVAFDTTGKIFAILRQREVDIATWSDFNTIRVANPKIMDTFRYRRTSKVPSYVAV